MSDNATIDEYVAIYGETYRPIITDALAWIAVRERIWADMNFEVDRDRFVEGVVKALPEVLASSDDDDK